MANGKAGAPKGNRNAENSHMMRNALIKAVKIESGIKVIDGGKGPFSALVEIAQAQIKVAKQGDVKSFTAIADRLDGRPNQTVAIDTAEGISFNLNYTSTE